MSVVQRIMKNLGAMFASNIVSVLTELLQPFIFLHAYGTSLYADWIVLSAAVAYLANLNFGLQTFINQDLAVRYNRGEREGYHVQQSTALRLLLGIVLAAATVCLVIFALPVEKLLHLSISHRAATWTLYLIALQILTGNLIFSYFAGNFMGVGLAHRGTHWGNAQRLCTTLLLCGLAWWHAPFPLMAGAQLALYLFFVVAVLVDLRRLAPDIFPTLRHWDRSALSGILKPSGYFGLIFWSTFLSFQLPVLLLQRMAGPQTVVLFTLGRKLFGMARQVLNGITQSMGPEITRLFGQGDWSAMIKLYDYSERLIFFLTTVGNTALYIASPLLLLLWMHRPGLFQSTAYVLLAAVNITLCVKEHKYQFQFATNTHTVLAKVMFTGYIIMVVVSLVTIRRYGLNGFLWTWLLVEMVQTALILRMNKELFTGKEGTSVAAVDAGYLLRLAGVSTAGLIAGMFLLRHTREWSYTLQAGSDLVLIALIAGVAFFVFQMAGMGKQMRAKLASRFGG
jgi:O-antigen/teichoic acid export membrane protein